MFGMKHGRAVARQHPREPGSLAARFCGFGHRISFASHAHRPFTAAAGIRYHSAQMKFY
jgi:hypothetical protein